MITRSCSIKGLVINVRGINASGKSTAVREFCRTFDLKPEQIQFQGNKYRVMTDGKKYVIGWYKPYSDSEGCDSLDVDKEAFKRFLQHLIGGVRPELIVYEKQIWSTTYKLTGEIIDLSKAYGYNFLVVQMMIGYEDSLNRLFFRNGGKNVNLENFDTRFTGVQRSLKQLEKRNIFILYSDPLKIPIERMKEVLLSGIEMVKRGQKRGSIPYPE